jgi:hypothetical protein
MAWPVLLLSQTKMDKKIAQRAMHAYIYRVLVTSFQFGKFERD